jgi:ABC-2 type transport system ATP-binding protein
VRCVTTLGEDALKALPAVDSMRRDGPTMEFLTHDAETLVRALLTRDEALAGLEVTGAGLEEAFIALTRAAPRQAETAEAVA